MADKLDGLESTRDMLECAFPGGTTQDDYFPLMGVLHRYMSFRQLANILNEYFQVDWSEAYNDVMGYRKDDPNYKDTSFDHLQVINRLKPCGFDTWIRSDGINHTMLFAENIPFDTYKSHYGLQDTEWIDGKVIAQPDMIAAELEQCLWLTEVLKMYVSANDIGCVLNRPYKMCLPGKKSVRQPDIQVILADRLDIVGETRVDGPADLVVEVLSPGSEEVDRGAKYLEYEAGDVREYWIIDPLREEALFYVRDDAGLFRNRATADGVYTSHVLDRWTLDVATLWQETLPDIRATTAMVDAMLA